MGTYFQMGAFDPPGTTYIPGLRENLYGLFTINLGVYVPDVYKFQVGSEVKKFCSGKPLLHSCTLRSVRTRETRYLVEG